MLSQGSGPVLCVVVASGAAWESAALAAIDARPDVVLLKRAVDVADLLAAAALGQADVAVVAIDAPGLDVHALEHLRRHRMSTVAILDGSGDERGQARAGRLGIEVVLVSDQIGRLADLIAAVPSSTMPAVEAGLANSETRVDAGAIAGRPGDRGQVIDSAEQPGRVMAVWGPAGAPGRTTVATGLAAVLAQRRRSVLLIDADPYGGAVAQHLGVLDEVSGLLTAARHSVSGRLEMAFHTAQRSLSAHLGVMTGLPRPERWVEVRSGVIEHVAEVGRRRGDVVIDTGFSLEDDPASEFGGRPGRNTTTLGALAAADEIIVVGAADPVGLARLARGLVDLRDRAGGAAVRVVINRSRPSLEWSEREIAAMVEGYTRTSGLHFLPEDRAGVDRALVAGRTLVESGDGPLLDALQDVVDAVAPETARPAAGRRRIRRRTGGRARQR